MIRVKLMAGRDLFICVRFSRPRRPARARAAAGREILKERRVSCDNRIMAVRACLPKARGCRKPEAPLLLLRHAAYP